MQALRTKTKKQESPSDRFLGEGARVLNGETIQVNNFITATHLEVAWPENIAAAERGMLYLFPIADQQFCLQLCFLFFRKGDGSLADSYSLTFLPPFFDQYPAETLMANQPFRFDETTELQFQVCTQTHALAARLSATSALTPFLQSLQLGEVALQLLRRALECITVPFAVCQVPACRFLANDSEREKITEAQTILDHSIHQPLTISELARKVAMNECYLKKGFKAMTGKTVHEYQQHLRIEKAKELLQEDGHSVTDVANMLGFSSISHFSTSFKRVTGMKPCELLA